jgi:hypothetical protein
LLAHEAFWTIPNPFKLLPRITGVVAFQVFHRLAQQYFRFGGFSWLRMNLFLTASSTIFDVKHCSANHICREAEYGFTQFVVGCMIASFTVSHRS